MLDNKFVHAILSTVILPFERLPRHYRFWRRRIRIPERGLWLRDLVQQPARQLWRVFALVIEISNFSMEYIFLKFYSIQRGCQTRNITHENTCTLFHEEDAGFQANPTSSTSDNGNFAIQSTHFVFNIVF